MAEPVEDVTTDTDDGAGQEKVDPDMHCAVKHRAHSKTARCLHLLDCRIHSEEQKQAVTDRSRPYQELRKEQFRGHGPTKRRTTKFGSYRSGTIDPDVHCLVPRADGTLCTNVLTCNLHREAEKRKVAGRTQSFDEVLRLYRINTTTRSSGAAVDPDLQCAVPLPNGARCPNLMSCTIHTRIEKERVARTYDYKTLFYYQTKQKRSPSAYDLVSGYGLAAAAAKEDSKIAGVRRRYRRAGMQNETLSADADGEVREPTYVMLSPVGQNLARIRQVLYIDNVPKAFKELSQVLPQSRVRQFSKETAKIIRGKDATLFLFVTLDLQSRSPPPGGFSLEDVDNAKIIDSTSIGVREDFFKLTNAQAEGTLDQLVPLLERFPLGLHAMNYNLSRIFLNHAISAATKGRGPQYTVRKAFVDKKPSLVMDIAYFNKESWAVHKTSVALPIHQQPKDVDVPKLQTSYQITGQDFGRPWLGLIIPEDKQRKLFDIAAYVVSCLHMKSTSQQQIQTTVVCISHSFEVALLIGPTDQTSAAEPTATGIIARFDADNLIVSATEEAKTVAYWLPNIQVPSAKSGWLVIECINNRFLHTQDIWIAWADGCNAADMHAKYGERLLNLDCSHSTEEAETETHSCPACGATTVCSSLQPVVHENVSARVCIKCRAPEVLAIEAVKSTESLGERKREPERTRVRRVFLNLISQERKFLFPEEDTESGERQNELTAGFEVMNNQYSESGFAKRWQFSDVYMSSLITRENSRLSTSAEALSPLVFVEGKPRYHHPSNMALTKSYANQLCGSFPPVALQILHRLDASKDNAETHANIERADHLHLVRSQIPWTRAKRLTDSYTDDFAKVFAQECRTGIATASGCARISKQDSEEGPYLWRINVQPMNVEHEDQLPDIDDVRQFISVLENRSGRSFRRINDVPYPFHGGPPPVKWSWTELYGLIATNLLTLTRWCNSRHVTSFTLSRLLCTFLRLVHGGRTLQRNQLLDIPISIWTRHLLSYSVGKDDHAREMSTGLSEDQPITLGNFDISAVNLCIEPWVCNAARGNRDDDVDAMRLDFRDHLKRHNPPHWTSEPTPIDAEISVLYIRGATTSSGDYTDDQLDPAALDEEPRTGTTTTTAVQDRRNMSNLSQTCYMSTVMQILRENEDVRRLVEDDSRFIYSESSGQADNDLLPHNEFLSDLSTDEILRFRQLRRSSQRLLIKAMQTLYEKLNAGGERLAMRETEVILKRLQLIDSRWENKANESAELLGVLLDNLVSASDRSTPLATRVSQEMARTQEADNRIGLPLADLKHDAERFWNAFIDEGHDSELTPAMFSQFVQEIPCGEDDCTVVSRGFESTHIIYLDFPATRDASQVFELSRLLGDWSLTQVDQAEGHMCENDASHTKGHWFYRCFTRIGKYICFAIRRGGVGQTHVLNQVRVPQNLDLLEYCKLSTMPSIIRQVQDYQEPDYEPMNYDLVAVNHWKSGHYIAYQHLATGDAQSESARPGGNDLLESMEPPEDVQRPVADWAMFNDLEENVLKKSPFVGTTEGELVHFAVYRRQDGQQSPAPPVRASERVEHDDDFPMIDTLGDERVSPPPAIVESGSHTRTTRQRPQSSEADAPGPRVVHSRGSVHGDVAAARVQSKLDAREAQLALNEAAFTRAQNQQELKEADLAKKLKDLEIREQRMGQLEHRAKQADQLEAGVQHLRNSTQAHLDKIDNIRSAFFERDYDFRLQMEEIDNQRQSIISRIEELQGELTTLNQQREQLAETASKDKQAIEAEIEQLKGLIIALMK